MTKLSVNLNKIALLRNARDIGTPSVTKSARTAIAAGAYGITIHPRPDQRHIKYTDVYELKEMLATDYKTTEFNIEGNPFTGRYMEIVTEVRPHQATLVPDTLEAVTSDHGWNLDENKEKLLPIIKQLKAVGIRISLFMDPDIQAIKMAGEIGADRIELYTEPYAKAFTSDNKLDETIKQYAQAAEAAGDIGLSVNAGHDLNLQNLGIFCINVPGVLEVSIGQALIVDAIEIGLYNAVREYVKILTGIK